MTAELAIKARNGQLTLYAGAGLSAAEPTSLPGASALAGLLVAELDGVVSFVGVAPDNLLEVADRIAASPRGLSLLKRTVLEVAELRVARPNYGHRVVALLLCEGAASVFETNYDTCIERAAQPEVPGVVRTDADLLQVPKPALLKAHGCAEHPDTMRVTSEELARPMWANVALSAQLSQDHVLFVGIGSVADYVRTSINGILSTVGVDHLTLVDPKLAQWDGANDLDWRVLLPGLPTDQRIATEASDFLDELLRAYAQKGLKSVRSMIAGLPASHQQCLGTESVLGALESCDAVTAVRWQREAGWMLRSGDPIIDSPIATAGLLALGALAGTEWVVTMGRSGWLRAFAADSGSDGDDSAADVGVPLLMLLVNRPADGAATSREARARIVEAKQAGWLHQHADVVVVVVGAYVGSLGLEEIPVRRGDSLSSVLSEAAGLLRGMPTDLVGDAPDDHLIDGGRSGEVYFVDGVRVAEAKAS